MISVCWTGANLLKLIKTFKFLELVSVNMLAMTNLAICMNLALVVMVSYLWQRNCSVVLCPFSCSCVTTVVPRDSFLPSLTASLVSGRPARDVFSDH